ncbi:MAG: ribonuclease H-like domain-containing protein [Lachnospiraceae bacterium]|nr:ribonuclease H-like domain-containing protein [Lachnospiraceae bacterium]
MLIKTYDSHCPHADYLPKGRDYLFFDIETTGFLKDTTLLYLIGCGYYVGDTFHMIQWFNDDAVSEEQILKAFFEEFSKKNYTLISFNGESFDIPYLKRHYEMNELDSSFLSFCVSLDIYRLMRPFQYFLGMTHGRQKDWEEYLGIHREDTYNGGQLISLYKEYLKTHDSELLKLLLLHNRDDILGMSQLLPLLALLPLSDGNFTMNSVHYSDKVYESIGNAALEFEIELPLSLPTELGCQTDYGSFEASGKKLRLTIPSYVGELRHYYANYREYYYLPEEDRAIHYSIGRYVDPKHRRKAKASTCYGRRRDVFLPCTMAQHHYGFLIDSAPSKIKTTYRFEYPDRQNYVTMDDLLSVNPESINDYLCNYLKYIMTQYICQRA